MPVDRTRRARNILLICDQLQIGQRDEQVIGAVLMLFGLIWDTH